MEFILDLFRFVRERKKWVFLPMILLLVLAGLLIVFAASSPVAPFIYTLF